MNPSAWLAAGLTAGGLALLGRELGWGPTPPEAADPEGWSRLPPSVRAARRLLRPWPPASPAGHEPELSWLGHATVLLRWAGQTVLCDPVFRPSIAVSRRRVPPPLTPPALGPVPLILLTHAHLDHLDPAALRFWQDGATHLLLPAGTERFLPARGRPWGDRLHPLRPGQTFPLGLLRVRAEPARHGGWRYPWQRGLFALSYLVEGPAPTGRPSPGRVYLAGDTAWGPHFAAIGAEAPVDWAVLPIGAYAPRWFLGCRHLDPEQAVAAAQALRARRVLPCHFGTYRLSLDRVGSALPRFARAAAHADIEWSVPVPHPSPPTPRSGS